MIWGYPYFWKHPYLNISLNGIQTSLPKEDGLSRLIVSIFISKFVNIKVTTLGRHRLGTNTSGLFAIDTRNQAKEALRNHHSEEPLKKPCLYNRSVHGSHSNPSRKFHLAFLRSSELWPLPDLSSILHCYLPRAHSIHHDPRDFGNKWAESLGSLLHEEPSICAKLQDLIWLYYQKGRRSWCSWHHHTLWSSSTFPDCLDFHQWPVWKVEREATHYRAQLLCHMTNPYLSLHKRA